METRDVWSQVQIPTNNLNNFCKVSAPLNAVWTSEEIGLKGQM